MMLVCLFFRKNSAISLLTRFKVIVAVNKCKYGSYRCLSSMLTKSYQLCSWQRDYSWVLLIWRSIYKEAGTFQTYMLLFLRHLSIRINWFISRLESHRVTKFPGFAIKIRSMFCVDVGSLPELKASTYIFNNGDSSLFLKIRHFSCCERGKSALPSSFSKGILVSCYSLFVLCCFCFGVVVFFTILAISFYQDGQSG